MASSIEAGGSEPWPDTDWSRFLEVVPAILWMVDTEGRLTILSEAGAAWLGVPLRLEIPSGHLDLIHPEERDAVAAETLRARMSGELLDIECRTRIADGSYRWTRVRGRKDSVSGVWHGATEDVHERREAELALRIANERLASALDGGNVSVWDLDVPAGRFWHNERQQDTFKCAIDSTKQDVSDLEELVHPADRQRVSRALRAYLAGHTDTYDCEYRVRDKDRNWSWVSDRSRVVERNSDGKPLRATGTRTDITAHKTTEARLRARESHLETLLDNIVDGVVAATPEGGCAFYNKAYARLFLNDDGSAPWQHLSELFSLSEVFDANGNVFTAEKRPIARVLQGEAIRNMEVTARLRESGRTYHLIYNGQPVYGADGSVELAVFTIRDITDRRLAEAALRENEAKFRGIFESGVVGMAILNQRTGTTLVANDQIFEITGLSREDFEAGHGDWRVIASDDHPPLCEAAACEAFTLGHLSPYEKVYQRPDGSRVDVRLSSAPLPNLPDQIVLCIEDVSERKKAEQALAASEERLRAIVESLEEGVVAYAPVTNHSSANSAFHRMFGPPNPNEPLFEDLDGAMQAFDLLDAEGRILTRTERPMWRVLQGERIERLAVRARFADGRWLDVIYRGAPILGEDGAVKLAVLVVRDVTEQNKARADLATVQQELIHVSRVSAVGTMAGSLAHELNQPLAAIANYAAAARMMLANEDMKIELTREALKHVTDEALRAGQIVHRLRRFITKGEVQRRSESLTSIVREALAIAHSDTAARGMNIKLELAASADAVIADRIQLQQVVFNLVRNAVEAMAGGPNRELSITSCLADDMVQLLVADRGPGLPPEVQAHLFEPFVTTKASGMGIGLSICHSIIRAHGGDIRVESRSGGGTIFTVTLPRAETAPAE